MSPDRINVLFVCSMNQWRSPTAERIYSKASLIRTRSGGTSPKARHTVSAADIEWADVVIVMEKKHKQRLWTQHSEAMQFHEVRVLDIPDDYTFMDPELITELKAAIDPIIEELISDEP